MAAALFSAKGLRDFEVYDPSGERLGTLVDVMLTIEDSRVRYVALAFEDERGAAHDKLIAVPITSLRLDTENECFVLDLERAALAAVPGFRREAPPAEPEPLLVGRVRPSSHAPGGASA